MVEEMLYLPQDPNTFTTRGALHFAAEEGSLQCVSLLLEAKADHATLGIDHTPLHLAARNGHVEVWIRQ